MSGHMEALNGLPPEADAYLQALLDYSGAFYSVAIEKGISAVDASNAVHHIERAARNLHRLVDTQAKQIADLNDDTQRLHKDSFDRWERVQQLERALNFVARFAWTKPDLTLWEALATIAYQPDVKEIIERWQQQEPEGERHWKLRDFKSAPPQPATTTFNKEP